VIGFPHRIHFKKSARGPAAARRIVLFLPLFCAVGIGVGWFLSFRLIYRAMQSRNWEPLQCEVMSSRVVTSDDSSRPEIQHRYYVDDRAHTGDRYNFIPGSNNFSDYGAVVAWYPAAIASSAMIRKPDRSGDRPRRSFGISSLIFFVFFTILPGVLMVAIVAEGG
jgi:hypothetical protein